MRKFYTTIILLLISLHSFAQPAPIAGPSLVSVGSSILLMDVTPGGSWSSYNNAVATVNSSGLVTGVGAGLTMITYTVGVLYATCFVSVNSTLAAMDANYVIQPGYYNDQVGEPVNVATGSYGYKHTDINIPTINTSLNFVRYYNTVSASVNSHMGNGWCHSYDCYVTNIHDSLWKVHYGDGHSTPFIPVAGGLGASTPLYGSTYETLYKDPGTGNFKVTFKSGLIYLFNSSLQLASITDLNGNVTTLSYSGGNLTSITAPGGRTLTLAYAGALISNITDQLGRTIAYSYDVSGNLVQATDANTGVTTFAYNSTHLITHIATARGNTLLNNTYDSQNRVITQSDALGGVTSIAYDPIFTGYATITYPDGHTKLDYHDSYYRLATERDELGHTAKYTYDSTGNFDSLTDQNSHVTRYTFDTLGNCLSTVKPTGITTLTSYNSFNKPTVKVDALGNTSNLNYDTHGNLTSVVLPDGSTKNYTYYTTGLMHTAIDALGHVTTYVYNASGDLTSSVSPAGTKTFTYDLAGRRTGQTDENGHTTTYGYNNNDMVTKITDPLGAIVRDSFDSDNNLIYATDKNGNHTQYVYDTKDRLASTIDAGGGTKSYHYDSRDNVTSITDPNGNTVNFAYDAKNQMISTTNSLGATTFAYDSVGNKISETDALGHTKHNIFDALNRLVATIDPLGNAETYTYDAIGQLTGLHDALGRTTIYTYNSVGLLTSITDPAGHTTLSGYDGNRNRTSITDPNSHIQSFSYDASNRINNYTDGAGNVYGFTYDGVGNVLVQTKPGGGTITKTYNAINNVTNVANSTGDNYTYTYDANGNKLTAANTTGTSAFNYDSLNHLKKYTDMFGNIVQYTYDLAGNKKSIVYPGGHAVSYNYNSVNLMDSVTDWLGHITHYNYDANGRLARMIYPNGATGNYVYDIAGRLTSLADSLPTAVICKSLFTLDAVGNRTQENRQGPIPAHLAAASFANVFGNDDGLTSDSVTTYLNNPAGNRISEVNIGGTTTYAFSVDNLLNSYTAPTTGTTTYTYDALANRVTRTQGGATRQFVLDLSGGMSQVLAEQDNTGAAKADYIYGLGLIARIDSAGNIQYYHFDAQHNTAALSNASGTITDTYTYDPFGAMLKHTGTTNQPCTFMGQFGVQQESPSLYYARARYYDAANGRFLSKDTYPTSLSNPQGLNRYVYVMNNPVTTYDPSGLFGSLDNDGGYHGGSYENSFGGENYYGDSYENSFGGENYTSNFVPFTQMPSLGPLQFCNSNSNGGFTCSSPNIPGMPFLPSWMVSSDQYGYINSVGIGASQGLGAYGAGAYTTFGSNGIGLFGNVNTPFGEASMYVGSATPEPPPFISSGNDVQFGWNPESGMY